MGLFQHRPEEEENQWAGLPSEPLEHEGADVLDAVPSVDPMALGLGASVSSIVFPVAVPAPAAVSTENGEPEDEPEA
ncbi:hypothetical protein ACYX8G_17170 [Microbacterium saperdae]